MAGVSPAVDNGDNIGCGTMKRDPLLFLFYDVPGQKNRECDG